MPIVKRDLNGFERLVFAEVLVPNVPTGFGDLHTLESIKDFAYRFAKDGYSVDIEHAQDTAEEEFAIVESFIAREGDTEFTPGAWVVGALIFDDNLWQDVIEGKINGFSYQAEVKSSEVEIVVPEYQTIFGVTEPDPIDNHIHDYFVIIDSDYKPIMGGTSEANSHTHTIAKPVTTEDRFNHNHRYNFIQNIPQETV